MQRSRHQIRERLRYDGDKEEELMRQFGLDYVIGPDGHDNVPVPEILACLIMEAGEWCNIGMYGSAVPLYEDALSLLNHFPNGPLRCEPIYWLRARCYYEMDHFEKVIQDCTQVINFDKGGTFPCTWNCYTMKVETYLEIGQIDKALETAYQFHIHCPWLPQATAIIGDLRRQLEAEERKRKKLGDKLIQQEEQSKRRRTVRDKPPLMKKKKKKAKDPRTAGASKRGATNETTFNESDTSSTSDSEPQGVEEEDPDQAALAMVGKSLPPISTHNRFVNAPQEETRKQKHTVTSTKRRTHPNVHEAARPTADVPTARSPRHVREFPSMMIGKSQSHRGFSKREQPFQSPRVQATAGTERRSVPYTSATLRRAETSYPKRLFPTCLEDINKGNTAMQEAKCFYCQLQCNSKQQLQKHYQGKKHRAKLLSDDSDGMWQQRRPPPGVPGGQYKMCPYGFERCIHRTLCTYAHTKEELKEWQERYNIRKKTLNKAQSSGTYGYSFGERLAEEFSKAKDKAELLSTTVQYARLLAEPEGTSVMFPEQGREYTWTLKVQTRMQLKKVAFMETSCSQFKINAVNSTSNGNQPLDGLLSEDGQEWISHGTQQCTPSGFTVQITFCSNQYGSFNQAVVFDLGQRPFLFCPLHVDVAMKTDLDCLTELRDTFTLLGASWENQGKVVHFLEEAGTDQYEEEELRRRYTLTSNPENLVTLKVLKDEMLTKSNYKQRQHQLLFIEEAEQTKHVRRLTLQTMGSVSNTMEKTFTDSTKVEFAQGGERFIQIFLNEELSEDTPQGYLLTRSLSPKAQVIIHTECLDQDAYEVWVEWTTKDSIWLRIPSSVCQHFGLEQVTEVSMEVQFMLDRSPMLFRHCAVDTMKDPTLVFPDNPNVSKRFWKNLRKESLSPPHRLNDKQREAFAKITAPTERFIPPLLLIGPFGTGKTYTIAAAASVAARQDDSRILICTHTNDAADLYIRKYLKIEDMSGSRTLRIYYKKRKKTTVHDDVLRHCVMNEDGTFRYPTREEVAAAKIVITTLSLSLVLEREVGLDAGFFTHIMVDEAAQALECEAITPLSLATAKTRVVLTGDHMQLSPKVFSSFAREKEFHQSLLERLFYHYQQLVPDDDLHPCITLLHENYRCHNDILKFPSKVFYGGKLICRSEAKKHPNFPSLAFYTAYGLDSAENATTSFYNDAEVWEVADRVEALWNSWPEAEWGEKDDTCMEQIGVVTPYQDQVNRIRLALRRKGLGGVTVETVTNVQGKEYQALFLSTVRTRVTCCAEQLNQPQETPDFGFLSDPKLLNTAITRAKSFVGVVGDPVSLCSVGSCSKIWFEYIEVCSKHRSLHGTSVEQVKHYLDVLEMEASSLPVASVLRPEAPIFVPQQGGVFQLPVVQDSHVRQQKGTRNQTLLPAHREGESKRSSLMKEIKPTVPTSKPPGCATTNSQGPHSSGGVTDGQSHSHKGLKVPGDSLTRRPKDAASQGMGSDLISATIQRQISKAESTAEDDLNRSSSSDSDEMIENQTGGGQTQSAMEMKTAQYMYHAETTCKPALSPVTTTQKEDNEGLTYDTFTDDKDDIVKELQKQVRRVEDPEYAQNKLYEEEYPRPREALGTDESCAPRWSDSMSKGGKVKHKTLFSLGTSIVSSSKRAVLSTEGYKARYTYAELDENSERLRGRSHVYQKHFHENTLYEVLEKNPDKYVKCRVQMSKAFPGQGHGVMEDPASKDIQLHNLKRLNRAFDGDEVVVELDTEEHNGDGFKAEETRREGSVIGILRPAVPHEDLQFVCYVDDHDPNVLIPVQKGAPKIQNVVPQDIEGPTDFIQLYSITEDGKLKSKQRVPFHLVAKQRRLIVVRFLKWEPHFAYPLGFATKMMEPGDSEDHAVNALMADHMIQETFPQEVLDHVDRMFPEDLPANDSYPNRKDLTDLVAVTIDPLGARDLDDALSVQQLKNGKYEVSIHIADVSNFIKKGDPVDREALARGTSYYPHTAEKPMVPMLPSQLCTNLLSLIPEGKKYTITVCMEIDEKSGKISKPRFFRSKIRSKVQLTYQQAQSILDGETATEESIDRDIVLSIQRLGRLSKMLRSERLSELAFVHKDMDEDIACSDAHYLVAEFMILANKFVAEHVMEYFPYCTLLRRQLPPKDHKMMEWKDAHGDTVDRSLLLSREIEKYNSLCSITDTDGREDQQFQDMGVIIIRQIIWTKIIQAAEDGDFEKLEMLVLFDDNHPQLAVANGHYRRIQNRAMYVSSGQYPDNPEVYGHFSFNLPAYTQFTSPIRRYADIVVHRLLVAALTGSTCPYEQEEMEELCAHLTQKSWNSKAFDKRVFLIKMAFKIQERPFVQQPFIEAIDERRLHLNFPDCHNIPAFNRIINMAHLQPDQQPTRGEETVTFVWRLRIYDFAKFNQDSHSSNPSFLPDDDAVKTCTYTKRISSSTWKAMVEAIREKSMGAIKQVVDTANQKEVNNDSEQQRLLEMSRADTTTEGLQRLRTKGVEEDYEDALLVEEEGNTTEGSGQAGGDKSSAKEFQRYNKTIEVTYSPCDVLQVQLTTEMYRGLLTPTIQLLKLTPAVDICLEHRRDPVRVFATRTGDMASKERYESLKEYARLWRQVVEMEAAYSSNSGENVVTIMGIKIQWKKKRGEIQGTFTVPGEFARGCCFLIRSGDQLCVRYANLDSTSDVINTSASEDSSTEESDDTSDEDSFESTYSDAEDLPEDALNNNDKDGPTWVAHCIVHKVTPHPVRLKERVDKYKITVRLHYHSAAVPRCLLEPAFGARRSCTVEHIPVPLPIRRMRSAVEGLVEQSEECVILEEICLNKHPERLQLPDQDLKARSKDHDLGTLVQGSVHLNNYQRTAVQRALCYPFYVIQGPPGTGKTVTGAHLAYKFAKRNRNAQSGDVIMYCGPSNKSVDVVAELLMNCGLKVLRVYSKRIEETDYPIPNYPRPSQNKKSNQKLRSITLHHVIRESGTPYGQQLREMEETFRRKQLEREPISDGEVDSYLKLIWDASCERIKGADIVLCTCNVAADKKFTSEPAPVKQCIIDEAGMCMEPESLIPISSFPLQQVVLIGDHQQLQPIVSQPDARDLGLGVSLFQRHAQKAFMLQIQYRMHEKVCEFPSHQFYDNKLKTADSVKARRPDMVPDSFWPSGGSPVVFCHVEGVEEALSVASAEGGVMSQSNQQEVHKVVQIVNDLVVRHHVKTSQIAVLSPYRAQVHQITETLKERKLDRVSVRTIVDSQGSEWDYVILSTVRSLPQGEIPTQPSRRWMKDQLGFLTDDHQINVGLTRARRGIIIVGNKNLLSTYNTWSDLVNFYEKKGYLVDATQYP